MVLIEPPLRQVRQGPVLPLDFVDHRVLHYPIFIPTPTHLTYKCVKWVNGSPAGRINPENPPLHSHRSVLWGLQRTLASSFQSVAQNRESAVEWRTLAGQSSPVRGARASDLRVTVLGSPLLPHLERTSYQVPLNLQAYGIDEPQRTKMVFCRLFPLPHSMNNIILMHRSATGRCSLRLGWGFFHTVLCFYNCHLVPRRYDYTTVSLKTNGIALERGLHYHLHVHSFKKKKICAVKLPTKNNNIKIIESGRPVKPTWLTGPTLQASSSRWGRAVWGH